MRNTTPFFQFHGLPVWGMTAIGILCPCVPNWTGMNELAAVLYSVMKQCESGELRESRRRVGWLVRPPGLGLAWGG